MASSCRSIVNKCHSRQGNAFYSSNVGSGIDSDPVKLKSGYLGQWHLCQDPHQNSKTCGSMHLCYSLVRMNGKLSCRKCDRSLLYLRWQKDVGSSIGCNRRGWCRFTPFNRANLPFTTIILSESCAAWMGTYCDWKGENYTGKLYYIKTIKLDVGFQHCWGSKLSCACQMVYRGPVVLIPGACSSFAILNHPSDPSRLSPRTLNPLILREPI